MLCVLAESVMSECFCRFPDEIHYLVDLEELQEGEDEMEIQEGDHLGGEIILGSHG